MSSELFTLITHHSSLITYFQAVVAPLDATGQERRVARVLDVVGDVCEVGAARLQLLDVGERAFEPEVRRVRAQAQAVEDERIEAAQHVERAGRNLAQVGGVGEVVEAVGHDGEATVYDLDRRDEQIGAETELRAVFDRVRDDLRQAAAEVRRLEDVLEDAADVRPGAPVCVDSQSAVAEGQGADVLESSDVVGVAVRDEHGVEVLDALTKRLLPEIGRRVNEYRLAVVLDEHGDAQAFVARVVRRARLALAADGGHAGRSARA